MVENIRNSEFTLVDGDEGRNHTILLAQAEASAPDAGAPVAEPAETTEVARLVIEVENGELLRLPANASVDQPRVNGTDLEFVQPDGSIIVVPEGAIIGLTIFIGDIEIPPQTVAALFQANGIEAAAGPGAASQHAAASAPAIAPRLEIPFTPLLLSTDSPAARDGGRDHSATVAGGDGPVRSALANSAG